MRIDPREGRRHLLVERNMMRLLEPLVKATNRLAEQVAVLAFSSLVAVIIVGIFFRYVVNDSLVWTEELARYLFIWVTFLGGGIGVGRNIHVGVDSLTRLLPSTARKLMEILIELIIGIFIVTLIVVSTEYAVFGMKSFALLFPVRIGYVYLAVPVGGCVMLLNLSLNIVRHLGELLAGPEDRACGGLS